MRNAFNGGKCSISQGEIAQATRSDQTTQESQVINRKRVAALAPDGVPVVFSDATQPPIQSTIVPLIQPNCMTLRTLQLPQIDEELLNVWPHALSFYKLVWTLAEACMKSGRRAQR